MVRSLHGELIDDLPADHPGAIGTRRDLVRLNTLMGHVRITARVLRPLFASRAPRRIVEIGAGDGEMLLRVAQRLGKRPENTQATLVDFQDLLRHETRTAFGNLGWRVKSVQADIFKWLSDATAGQDLIFGNLVLHHFTDAQLASLFWMAAKTADTFIALEPRRGFWPLFCTRWLFLVGCNPVTCHDGPVSVRAGFRGRELSALWPDQDTWELRERRAGLFSHLFVARRKV